MGIRLKEGWNVWECDCGELSIMGQKCRKCGNTYADILAAKAKAEKQAAPQKPQKKTREPALRGQFIESFLFDEKKN